MPSKKSSAYKKFNYFLPPELIAQSPCKPRDHSRLMVINRQHGRLSHHHFFDLPRLLQPSDVLVFNDSQVIPARLYGHKTTGGKVEILLLRKRSDTDWEYISHPGLRPGQQVNFNNHVSCQIITPNVLKLKANSYKLIAKLGHTPLPPYIKPLQKESIVRRQYQTVYADPVKPGSSAAPTAGLHFTRRILSKLTAKSYQLEYLTLHVGLGTFKSPTPDQIRSGRLHSEFFTLDPATSARLNAAKKSGRRIIAVGTTACRVLESCSDAKGLLTPHSGDTDIFIQPGYKFKFVDGLITNFHLPNSSLIMLISAFSSWPIIKKSYSEATRLKYRFYSFGDSTLII